MRRALNTDEESLSGESNNHATVVGTELVQVPQVSVIFASMLQILVLTHGAGTIRAGNRSHTVKAF